MLNEMICEVKDAIECAPSTEEVCKNITFIEMKQAIKVKCKNTTIWEPFQERWHLKKCLFPTNSSTLDENVLKPLKNGQSADLNPDTCPDPDWTGDGICDDETNIEVCNFDGGDCCNPKASFDFCEKCECHQEPGI